jgi:glycosyltransferase involved in cell wall biosynthesis
VNPRFSILLPTRNRLSLLSQAVETVRRQDFDDWEIVISDNASEQDVSEFVAGLKDSRIRYLREPELIHVTANWNQATDAATGDWIIMLGDDDGLMPGALRAFDALIVAFEPDLIYGNAFLLTYPGVLAEAPQGAFGIYSQSALFRGRTRPYLLSPDVARSLVSKSMNFEMAFTFNMQHSVMSRTLVDRVRVDGELFHSPYPDFYATNVLFLEAGRILVNPTPLATIGLSPKSFGFYYFNRREDEGVAFLHNEASSRERAELEHIVLPGSADRTSWLIAIEAVRRNFGERRGLKVSYGRYRRLQLFSAFGGGRGAVTDPSVRRALYGSLRPHERLLIAPAISIVARVVQLLPGRLRMGVRRAIHRIVARSPIIRANRPGAYANMIEVFDDAAKVS